MVLLFVSYKHTARDSYWKTWTRSACIYPAFCWCKYCFLLWALTPQEQLKKEMAAECFLRPLDVHPGLWGARLTAMLPCYTTRRAKRAGSSINHTSRTVRSRPRFTPNVLWCHLISSTHFSVSISTSLYKIQYRNNNNNQINYCQVMLGLMFGDLLL